jgi:hypothetical protein
MKKFHFLLNMIFFLDEINNPTSKFTKRGLCLIYVEWCKRCWIPSNDSLFRGSFPISRCFGTLCKITKRLQHISSLFLISFDRCWLCFAPCKIWRRVIRLSFEKWGSSLRKCGVQNRWVFKKLVNLTNSSKHRSKLGTQGDFRLYASKLLRSELTKMSKVVEMVSSRFYWLIEWECGQAMSKCEADAA